MEARGSGGERHSRKEEVRRPGRVGAGKIHAMSKGKTGGFRPCYREISQPRKECFSTYPKDPAESGAEC